MKNESYTSGFFLHTKNDYFQQIYDELYEKYNLRAKIESKPGKKGETE